MCCPCRARASLTANTGALRDKWSLSCRSGGGDVLSIAITSRVLVIGEGEGNVSILCRRTWEVVKTLGGGNGPVHTIAIEQSLALVSLSNLSFLACVSRGGVWCHSTCRLAVFGLHCVLLSFSGTNMAPRKTFGTALSPFMENIWQCAEPICFIIFAGDLWHNRGQGPDVEV